MLRAESRNGAPWFLRPGWRLGGSGASKASEIGCADFAYRERDGQRRAVVVGGLGKVDTIRQWRIVLCVEFIETPTFTRLIGKLMDDDEYAKLQLTLALRPDWGKVIPGSGGLRKLRWAGSGRGKRGGLRIIYYWQTADDQIWLLVAYPKSERDDLSHDVIKQLRRLVEEFEL